ncbi:CHASE domain-containing protein [Sphingosinicella terrae]|uniref:CHASE domain-containing protein n=1 Tax=Sphingosinicella terrae TaxID=2172047 RepID=UPI000E0D9B3B|nr:CHASE domain-containing protein [Sphingosinicella terrae]
MKGGWRFSLPLAALLVGLIGTLVATLQVSQAAVGRMQARFEALAAGAVADIEGRVQGQVTLLRATAGFFNASDRVTRDEFRVFVERLRLERNYPGVLGIGYAAYEPTRERLADTVATAQVEGSPEFRVWPAVERRGGHSAILMLEPLDRRNAAALGYDMLSEATRQAAMRAAAATDSATMSGRVRLVQEIDPVKQPGFLIYVPLYRRATDDRPELRGWVYSPLRAYDLFRTVFAQDELTNIVVEIHDQAVAPERLLFQSGPPAQRPKHVQIRPVEIAGRQWVVRVSSTAAFEDELPVRTASVIALAGVAISVLLALLMLQQTQSAWRTQREVDRRTAELREANARLVAEAEAREVAEAQLRQMQKMDAIGQLTGGIAHDFNNMLAIIIGNLDMAQRRADDPPRLRRALAHAAEGAHKAADLTRRLLAFGRRQPLDPRAVDANALLLGMSDLLRRSIGEKVRLDLTLAPDLWAVHVDPVQLENAILNLAINGRDAMPDGGTLTIATGNRAESGGPGPAGSADDLVLISVRDTGVGMDEEVAARALEPFFTTKAVGRGTGLGLSQVFGFVQQSGGTLSIDSSPGAGTRIDVRLPRHNGTVQAAAVPDEAIPAARGGECVLVVEDQDQVRRVAVEALRELGYSVVEASGGAEALGQLERNPDIRLLFSDVVMPEMDGRQLAEEARRRRPDLKIVLTTGYAPAEIFADNDWAGWLPLLRKPFTMPRLARLIREVLDRNSAD